MKVLLVQPPIEDFYDTPVRTYPLGLTYLASAVEDMCDVSILDLRTGYKSRKADNIFPELNPFYRDDRKTPFSLFARYSRYGMDVPHIRQAITHRRPDLVGISSSFTAYAHQAMEIAKITKEIDRGIITVMGGTHPTLFPNHVIDHPDIDYVIRGEGETPFCRLIEYLSKKSKVRAPSIPGLAFDHDGRRHVGEISYEEHIDTLPARHLLSPDTYRIGKKPYTFLLTSRGCPFQCEFCGKPPVPYRRRTLQSIEEEIDTIVRMGIKAIDFEDDMLNLDIPFFHSLMDRLEGRELTLSAMNGIYSQNLDIPTLKKMYECGFRRLNFSLVDTSRTVHSLQKRAYPANLLDIMEWLQSSPYLVEAHFIIGLPGQTPAEIIDTMTYLTGKRLLPGPSIYYPAPGSSLFNEVSDGQNENFFPFTRSSVMYQANQSFSRNVTFTFMKLLRAINLMKGLVDANPAATSLSDLIDAEWMINHPRDRHILSTLIREKRFIWFDTRGQDYEEEPQDPDTVRAFFKALKGKTIKGFRTGNVIRIYE